MMRMLWNSKSLEQKLSPLFSSQHGRLFDTRWPYTVTDRWIIGSRIIYRRRWFDIQVRNKNMKIKFTNMLHDFPFDFHDVARHSSRHNNKSIIILSMLYSNFQTRKIFGDFGPDFGCEKIHLVCPSPNLQYYFMWKCVWSPIKMRNGMELGGRDGGNIVWKVVSCPSCCLYAFYLATMSCCKRTSRTTLRYAFARIRVLEAFYVMFLSRCVAWT